MRIKAVGMVQSINEPTNDDVFCVNVNYHPNYNIDGLTDFNDFDDGVKRNTRVYKETNQEVIQMINELLQR